MENLKFADLRERERDLRIFHGTICLQSAPVWRLKLMNKAVCSVSCCWRVGRYNISGK